MDLKDLEGIDIAKLSLSEQKKLLRTLIDLEQAKNSRKIDLYKPHNGAWRGKPKDGQEAFHKVDARIRLLLGGNQSGKSVAGAVEAVWTSLGIHPYRKVPVPNKGRIIASLGFEEGANQIIVPKLFEWLPRGSLKKEPKKNQNGVPVEWELTNGSVFNILSGEQDPKVFEGWTGHWAWADEPPTRGIHDATRRGLLRFNGHLWYTLTPLTEPWLYNDLYEPWLTGERSDLACFHVDMYDNCVDNGGYLPREAIEEFEKELPDDVRDARIHGHFRFLSGRVYKEFDPKIHVVEDFEIPPHWPVWEGIDPHPRKPHAYCQWAVDVARGEVFICNEIYADIGLPDLAYEIKKRRKGKNIVCTFIDSSAEEPDMVSRLSGRKILENCGIGPIRVVKKIKIRDGVDQVKELLTPRVTNFNQVRPRLFVFRSCKRHIKEFFNYVWDDRDTPYAEKENPRKIWDDFMDLDRYFAVENPLRLVGHYRPVRTSSFRYGRAGVEERV